MQKRIDAMLKNFTKAAQDAGLGAGKAVKSSGAAVSEQAKIMANLREQVKLRNQISDLNSIGSLDVSSETKANAKALADSLRTQVVTADELTKSYHGNAKAMEVIRSIRVKDNVDNAKSEERFTRMQRR